MDDLINQGQRLLPSEVGYKVVCSEDKRNFVDLVTVEKPERKEFRVEGTNTDKAEMLINELTTKLHEVSLFWELEEASLRRICSKIRSEAGEMKNRISGKLGLLVAADAHLETALVSSTREYPAV